MLWWRISWTAAIFSIPPALAASNSGLIQVTKVRAWSHSDSTRVILETTGPFEYRSDRAYNPDRLYVDILNARPWIAQHRSAIHEIGDRLVRRVRIAETSPRITRVVFDLVDPADFKITRLDAPDRLVIEFRPLANLGAPAPVSGKTPSVYAGYADASPRGRRLFVYPPVLYPPPLRRQISNLGAPPSIPSSMLQTTAEPVSFNFADPMESLLASLPVKPPGQMHASVETSKPAARMALVRILAGKISLANSALITRNA